ncbi:unnamed protein product [Nesidiocoris tenuis]|uniref:RRM domain-containing protein n=1 Tax=Nesidiocoris tenuis TaxID=355587 RepID=A0A6H5H4F0_9HEMI|nr:unnamed protein product [Nesidiocoris tenuis]
MDEERERERRRRERERQNRQSNDRSNNDRDRSPRGKKKTNRVFISNIPYEYRWQELKDLFREKVGEVSFVELFVDENEKPRGCGIIEFATASLAEEAVEKMHRYDLKGRKLVVKEDNDVERDKYGRILPRSQRSNNDGGRPSREEPRNSNWNDLPPLSGGGGPSNSSTPKWGNTYGLSVQFLESLNISPPLVPRCFVANLDYKVDDKKLREVFRLAGRVISAEISIDKEGKSRGFGVVEFEHPVEAVQAISMLHNQRLFDRTLSVRIDRADKGDGLPPKLPEGLKGIGMGLGANGAPLTDVATAGGGGFGSVLGPSLGRNSSSDFDSLSAALSGGGGAQGLGSSLSDRGLGDRSRSALTSGNSSSHSPSDTIIIQNVSFLKNALLSIEVLRYLLLDCFVVFQLPMGTTWQQLRDKCRDAGDVKFAELRGKDTGVVQFTNQWDAQRAISMLDGIKVDGRVMDVRFY